MGIKESNSLLIEDSIDSAPWHYCERKWYATEDSIKDHRSLFRYKEQFLFNSKSRS